MKTNTNGKTWLWHLIVIAYICFIYSNSMRPAVQSSAESGRVLRLLQELAAGAGIEIPWLTEHIVRKCAHFIEYMGLGVLLRLSAASANRSVWKEVHRIALLAVPFADETIQLFVEGRSGQISDVWLDLAGALTGTMLYLTLRKLIVHVKTGRTGK